MTDNNFQLHHRHSQKKEMIPMPKTKVDQTNQTSVKLSGYGEPSPAKGRRKTTQELGCYVAPMVVLEKPEPIKKKAKR